MNIFIDCEFNEFGGDLISMALVADDGQEFYEVLNLEKDSKYGDWVSKHVVPILNKDPISKDIFQAKLWSFINQWENVHIIADWPDDIKYFCMALILAPGTAINTPLNFTFQLDRSLSSDKSLIPHNALEDARAIRRGWHQYRKELAGYNVKIVT